MRNRVIQSNLSFVAPADAVTDLEFTFGDTQGNINSNDPSKNQHHDSFHSDLNEEHIKEVMFNDIGASLLLFLISPPTSLHQSQPLQVLTLILDSLLQLLNQLLKRSKLMIILRRNSELKQSPLRSKILQLQPPNLAPPQNLQ